MEDCNKVQSYTPRAPKGVTPMSPTFLYREEYKAVPPRMGAPDTIWYDMEYEPVPAGTGGQSMTIWDLLNMEREVYEIGHTRYDPEATQLLKGLMEKQRQKMASGSYTLDDQKRWGTLTRLKRALLPPDSPSIFESHQPSTKPIEW